MRDIILLMLIILIVGPGIGYAQTFDYNVFEQGPIDTLAADSTEVVADTIWFKQGQAGGYTLRGYTQKISGDDKTMTLKGVLFFDPEDLTDISDEKTIGTEAVTSTLTRYCYSLPKLNWWGIARGLCIIYSIPTGGTMPAIAIKGKGLTR